MSFFEDDGEDPFQDIMNDFFGNRRGVRTSSSRGVVNSEREERIIDYIEEEENVYFVFELPGFKKEDIEVVLKRDSLNLIVEKKNTEGIKEYLKDKLSQGVSFNKRVPVKVKKEMEWTFNNGVLEVKLERK